MEASSSDEYRLVSADFSHHTEDHEPVDGHAGQGLEVLVIFTDAPGTVAALQMADELAQKLEAQIKLLMPYEVPYTLPLSKPAVPVEFLEGQIRKLVSKTRLEVAAHIYLCRDKRRALEILLRPHSLVAVGGKKRWWRTPAQNLARDLQKNGHHVIFAELR
ncbi:MAG: hypothetical protein ACLQVL_16225 [Terriglobia bacterium]